MLSRGQVAVRRGLRSNLLWTGRWLPCFLFEKFEGLFIIPQEAMHPDRR